MKVFIFPSTFRCKHFRSLVSAQAKTRTHTRIFHEIHSMTGYLSANVYSTVLFGLITSLISNTDPVFNVILFINNCCSKVTLVIFIRLYSTYFVKWEIIFSCPSSIVS